jgi:hypothetical protein
VVAALGVLIVAFLAVVAGLVQRFGGRLGIGSR